MHVQVDQEEEEGGDWKNACVVFWQISQKGKYVYIDMI